MGIELPIVGTLTTHPTSLAKKNHSQVPGISPSVGNKSKKEAVGLKPTKITLLKHKGKSDGASVKSNSEDGDDVSHHNNLTSKVQLQYAIGTPVPNHPESSTSARVAFEGSSLIISAHHHK